MKKVISAFLMALLVCVCGCSQSGDTSSEPTDFSVSQNITSVASQKFSEIEKGMTYEEIINILGETESYGRIGLRVYKVDEKVLSIRFDSLTEKCELSGEELLKTAVPYKFSIDDNLKNSEWSIGYGVIIDDDFIFSANRMGSGYLETKDAEIIFENGEKAAEKDLKISSQVKVYYDFIEESFPATIRCKKIIIAE